MAVQIVPDHVVRRTCTQTTITRFKVVVLVVVENLVLDGRKSRHGMTNRHATPRHLCWWLAGNLQLDSPIFGAQTGTHGFATVGDFLWHTLRLGHRPTT